MGTFGDNAKKLFAGMFGDIVEERVIEFIVREIGTGRPLFEILDDPYVRNRLTDSRRTELLENPEILEAFEAEIKAMHFPE